jgi:hypothetical protein
MNSDWFLDEAFRVIEKGGWMIGYFQNRSSWRGLLYSCIPSLRAQMRVILAEQGRWGYLLSYKGQRKNLRKRGFTVVHEEGYGWPPFRRTSNSPLVPVATRIERYLGLRKLVSVSPWIMFIAQKGQ